DQMLVEPHSDVVVVLDQPRVSEANFIDEPAKVGDSAEEYFRATRIGVVGHTPNLSAQQGEVQHAESGCHPDQSLNPVNYSRYIRTWFSRSQHIDTPTLPD